MILPTQQQVGIWSKISCSKAGDLEVGLAGTSTLSLLHWTVSLFLHGGFHTGGSFLSGALQKPCLGFHVLFPGTARETCCPEPPTRSEDMELWFVPQASKEEEQGTGALQAHRWPQGWWFCFVFIFLKSAGKIARWVKCLLQTFISSSAAMVQSPTKAT